MTPLTGTVAKDKLRKTQDPLTTEVQKPNTTDMLSPETVKCQQSQPNLSNIQRARKFRNGQKRSQREVIERIFTVLKDGQVRSVARIARDSCTAWTSAYWSLDLIEVIQSMPHLERDPNPKRKRFYRLLAPGKRR